MGQCLPFIYACCRQQALSCYPPMQSPCGLLGRTALAVTGLHALSLSATHMPAITGRHRELLPRVLTLTLFIYIRWLFSSALRCPREHFPLGSGVSCSAPTFLLRPSEKALKRQTGRLALLKRHYMNQRYQSGCKSNQKRLIHPFTILNYS